MAVKKKYNYNYKYKYKNIYNLDRYYIIVQVNLNTGGIYIHGQFDTHISSTTPEQKRKYIRENQKIINDLKINGCAICGYNTCLAALEFHHVNPKEKNFSISSASIMRKNIASELNKCILLCSNCHREIHHLGEEKMKKTNNKLYTGD